MLKQSQSQLIGREGEKWFESQLPPSWIPQRPTEDIGVDYLVVICEDSKVNGLEFRVQIKSSIEFKRSNEEIRLSFNKNSLINLCIGYTPALIVAYETSSKTGYCLWANQILAKSLSLVNSNKKTITIGIPISREITQEAWPNIGIELSGVNKNIFKRLHKASWSFPVLKFVRTLSDCLRTFDSVAHHWAHSVVETKEQKAALHGLEIAAYMKSVFAIHDLQEELPKDLTQVEGLNEFSENLVKYCQSFAPIFLSLIENRDCDMSEEVLSMEVDHGKMMAMRAGFVRSILDVQLQVTDFAMDIQINHFLEDGA